jgi:hypothetical protein
VTLQPSLGAGTFRLTGAIVMPYLYGRQQFDVMEGASSLEVRDAVLASAGDGQREGQRGEGEEQQQQQQQMVHRRLLSLMD